MSKDERVDEIQILKRRTINMSKYGLMDLNNISNMPSNSVHNTISYLPKAVSGFALDLYERKLNHQELMRIYDILEICARNNSLGKEQMQFFAALIQFNKML